MAKFKKRRKMGKLGRTLLTIGCVALCIACLGAVVAFAKDDTKPVTSLEFSRGGLDPETGTYVETKKTLYTENGIQAHGLRIEPDFESTVSYDVYLYDGSDNLLEVKSDIKGVFINKVELASHVRIVIHPSIPEGVKEKNFEIKPWEIQKYASMLNISVSKEGSKYDFENLFVEETLSKGYELSNTTGEPINTVIESTISSITDIIEIDDKYDYYDVWVYVIMPPRSSIYVNLADAEGNIIGGPAIDMTGESSTGWYKCTVDLEDWEGAESMRVTVPIDYHNCYIYGYND